jgi:pimeloyl-ACP methyl ester carboxylesterase
MSVQPFAVDVPQTTLDDLRDRLARTRWPDEVSGAGWEYGTNLAYLQELVAYWSNGFDWREQEARINGFANYRAEIDGLGVHFIHQPGKGPDPIPLLLLHGWPSSFVQMLDIIPLLTDPASHGGDPADSFTVVAASLPGYGFSDRPSEPGMNVGKMAGMFQTLMTGELGYRRFAARGTDMGAGVLSALALAHPEAVIGYHTGGTNPWVMDVPDDLSEAERAFVAKVEQWGNQEMAYARLHATKPQTLAYGLNDSPVGLAAWIIEKFHAWSDRLGGDEIVIPRNDLLTNLTIYWVTQTINSSIRLYYETVRDMGGWGVPDVPTAMAMPPKDFFPTPREWAERSARIDRWMELPHGGHFPEWEVPGPLAEDMRAFFRRLRERQP